MYKTHVWILQEENSWGLEISVPVSDAQLRPWIWISGLYDRESFGTWLASPRLTSQTNSPWHSFALSEGHLTIKSNTWVGHLNAILAAARCRSFIATTYKLRQVYLFNTMSEITWRDPPKQNCAPIILSSWRATTLVSNIIVNINWLIDVYINLNEPNVIQHKGKHLRSWLCATSRSDINRLVSTGRLIFLLCFKFCR